MFKKTTCPECGAMWNEGVYDACPNCGWVVGADTPLKRAREEAERIEQEEKEKQKEKQRLEEEQKRQEQERIRLEYEHAKKLKEEAATAEILRTIGSRKVNPKIEKKCRTVAVLVEVLSFVFSLACFIVGFYFVFEISGIYVTGGFTLLVGGGVFLIIGIMFEAFMDLLVNIFACLFNTNEALRNHR